MKSQLLLDAAGYFWNGEEPTSILIGTSASIAFEEFVKDRAVSPYSYSSEYEHSANIFEAVMMKLFFDVDLDAHFHSWDAVFVKHVAAFY